MGTIASIDIAVKASTSDFSAGLKKAKVEGAAFVKDLGDKLGSIPFGAIGSGLAGIGLGIGAGLAALASSGLDRIDQLGDSAQRIGVTTDKLSELRYAANLTGSAAEDLDAALVKFNQNLGDTSEEGGKAGEGLKRLGLDSKELAQLTPDEAFKKVVVAFEKVTNASEKTRLAMDIFGKGGVKILNTLGAGGKQLEDLAAEARKLGVSVSQVDQAKVAATKDALDKAGAAVEGLGNVLAVQLAPIIDVVATAFATWLGESVTGAGQVEGALDGISKAMAKIADFAVGLESSTQEIYASVIQGSGSVLDFFGGDGSGARAIADTFRQDIKRAFDVKPSAKIAEFLEGVKSKSRDAAEAAAKVATANLGAGSGFDSMGKSIEDVTKKLTDQIATFGKSAAQIELYKLAQMGANSAQLDGVKSLADQLDALEKGKKAQEELVNFAKGLKDKIKSPAEKFLADASKIDEAVSKGLLSKTEGIKAKQHSATESGLSGESGKHAAALEFGSAEARSAILAARSGRGSNTLEEATRSVAANTKSATEYLASIARSLTGPPEEIRI